jgi:DNA-binding response OmpR family regulator
MNHSPISQLEPPVGAPAHGRRNPTPPRILLVEDDRKIRDLNADVLVQSGYQVDIAEDGAAAWRALQTQHYDAMVTDNTMPGVTGLELIKKLRSEDMTLAVILASGTAPMEELIDSPWLRIDAMLPKPYTATVLVKTVDEVLFNKSGTFDQAIALAVF